MSCLLEIDILTLVGLSMGSDFDGEKEVSI